MLLALAVMKTLEPPDIHHLRAASGWLMLGNHTEANEDLDRISPQRRGHPDVLEVRWQIYAKAEKWTACAEIANAVIKLDPNRSSGWIDPRGTSGGCRGDDERARSGGGHLWKWREETAAARSVSRGRCYK